MKKPVLLSLLVLPAFISFAQEEQVSIARRSEIDSVRNEIRNYIWSDPSDTSMVTEVKNDSALLNELQEYVEEYDNLKSVDRITVHLKNHFVSNCAVFHPKVYNHLGVGLIYHGGHDGFLWEDRYLNNSGRPNSISVINFFLGKGFDVICVDMPLCGLNTGSMQVEEDGQEYNINSHDDIFQLKQPFYYFLEPVKACVNFLGTRKRFERFAMLGLSGGGWTTTLYSAIDKRIVQSFAVAGSVPIPYRKTISDWGDMEQNFQDFYDRFNYSTLYTLAASGTGELHFQILNQNDNCCFDYNGSETWVPPIKSKLEELTDPGEYEFYYDPYATMHKISAVAMDTIYSYLRWGLLQQQLPVNATLKYDSTRTYFCKGDNLKLTVVSFKGDTIEWFRNNDLTPFASSRTVKITKSGSYSVKVTNISGIYHYSDTVNAFLVDLHQPHINERNDTLYSSEDSLNQWYRNGVPITNATGKWFKPSSPGTYSVILHSFGCVSVPSETYDYGLLIYPNPSSGTFNIILDPAYGTMQFSIYDINGRLILMDRFAGKKTVVGLRSGVYFLKFTGQKEKFVKRILVR